ALRSPRTPAPPHGPQRARTRAGGVSAARTPPAPSGRRARGRLGQQLDTAPGPLPLLQAALEEAHARVAQRDQLLRRLPAARARRPAAVHDDRRVLRQPGLLDLPADPVDRHTPRPGDQLAGEVLVGQRVPQLADAAVAQAARELVDGDAARSVGHDALLTVDVVPRQLLS